MSHLFTKTNYQREEITQTCCFMNTIAPNRESTPSTRRQYAHSLQNKSKEKKINLLIAKKGHSQEKTMGISLTKNLAPPPNNRSHKIIRTNAQTAYGTTLGSKEVSYKNSLSTSRMRPDQMLKIQRIGSIHAPPSSSFQTYPLKSNEVTFHQTKADISNLQLLSDITMVQQQFISHGSTTLNALNYLTNYTNTEKSRFYQQANSTIKMISNFPVRHDHIIQFRNPLERLTEKRNGLQKKKKLVL